MSAGSINTKEKGVERPRLESLCAVPLNLGHFKMMPHPLPGTDNG